MVPKQMCPGSWKATSAWASQHFPGGVSTKWFLDAQLMRESIIVVTRGNLGNMNLTDVQLEQRSEKGSVSIGIPQLCDKQPATVAQSRAGRGIGGIGKC